jgi:type IV secretion system protein VirB8
MLLVTAMTASIIFVKFVVSSKSLEPYVIEVEEKSGVPTVVDQLTSEVLTGDEAVKKYFVNQFLQASVGYNPKTYKEDAEKVRLLSTQSVYADFRKRINARRLGVDSRITIKIKSIHFPDSSTVRIRILRSTRGQPGNGSIDELVTIKFYFTNLSLTAKERLINPLGFQVKKLTIAEEIFKY